MLAKLKELYVALHPVIQHMITAAVAAALAYYGVKA